MAQNGSNPLLLALAIIGAIALILILGSWLFHASMMGGGMMGGGMGGMMGGMGAAAWLLGFLVVAGIVAVVRPIANIDAADVTNRLRAIADRRPHRVFPSGLGRSDQFDDLGDFSHGNLPRKSCKEHSG